jgi:hypothetical protein
MKYDLHRVARRYYCYYHHSLRLVSCRLNSDYCAASAEPDGSRNSVCSSLSNESMS